LLFDAAHAFACSFNGQMIGNFGDAEVFSFHATKFFNTSEGGAIVTNDDRLGLRLQLAKRFGFAYYDEVVSLGTNGKMSEISAAMGLVNLESLGDFVAANRRNYHAYRAGLAGIPGIHMLEYAEVERCNYQYIVLEIEENVAGLTRDELRDVLWAENVLARRYFYPGCHRMEPYRSLFPDEGARLPVTEKLADSVLVLPTGTATGVEEINVICGLVRLSVAHGREISRNLCSLHAAASD
jgi:dTDP-4-amino-4,6-dideoxygalactose transaminase